MAKIIDITDKLNFEELPKLKIRGVELRVNSDAPTVLRIMQKIGDGKNVTPKVLVDMYELIFPSDERKTLDKMKLNFHDFQKVVESAISLVTGTDMEEPVGE